MRGIYFAVLTRRRFTSRNTLRTTMERVGWILNCQAYDIPILVTSKLLKPLGSPAANSVKYFATAEFLELSKDRT
jgi:hypothetical protein